MNDAIRHLELVRELVDQKKYKEAEELVERHMLGPWNECYLPLGSFHMQLLDVSENLQQYKRSLDLTTGVNLTKFTINDVIYRREVMMSAPDHCMILRMTSTQLKGISAIFKLDSQLNYNVAAYNGDDLTTYLTGQCPSHVETNYIEDHPTPIHYDEDLGLRFTVGIRIITDRLCTKNEATGEITIRQADTKNK